MNADIIWQIAGLGMLIVVVHSVIKTAGRDELAWMVTVAGVVVVLWRVVGVVNDLFQAVKSVFQM